MRQHCTHIYRAIFGKG